jgi:hypothetical protein
MEREAIALRIARLPLHHSIHKKKGISKNAPQPSSERKQLQK